MGWMESVGEAIQYAKDRITQDLSVEVIAKEVGICSIYFQKGFSMLCGFTLTEYIRNRRLALATSDEKVIDIALKYTQNSPNSFTKAFAGFHGITPTQV